MYSQLSKGKINGLTGNLNCKKFCLHIRTHTVNSENLIHKKWLIKYSDFNRMITIYNRSGVIK